ncbi:MAG TPA: glycosyltransferase, partial [Gammaproteobacteria bacterium]|nr:glycosyltransferase [Gammaproteobacteria bacterium]
GSGREVRDYLDTLDDGARVRTLFLPHSGNSGMARNAAIAVARAPYIAFIDSDDLWEPRKLERQLATMRAEEGCDWSYTGVTFIDDEGKPLAVELHRRWTTYRGQVFERILRDPASVRTPTVVVTAQLLRDVGGFDEAIDCGVDSDLWLRLALRSPACIVGESLSRIRYHAENRKREASRRFASRDYSLRKLAGETIGAQRALLHRERSLNALLWDVETAAGGGRLRSVAIVGKSLPFGWKFALWWYESVKALVRACFLPSRAPSQRN